MFCEGLFFFSFTSNMLVHSVLREVGEGNKRKPPDGRVCALVRVRTCTCVMRESARVCLLIGERGGKVGRNARESGEG